MQNQPSKRPFIILGIVIVVGIVGVLASFLFNASTVRVEVVFIPSDSTVTMDGKPIKAGTLRLEKGSHMFVASRQYFETTTTTIDTNSLAKDEVVYIGPLAKSPEALKYLEEHPEEVAKSEKAGGDESAKAQEYLQENYPIVSSLPYETLAFRVDYAMDGPKVSFVVTLFPVGQPGGQDYKNSLASSKQEANEYLVSGGVDLKTATITYSPSE